MLQHCVVQVHDVMFLPSACPMFGDTLPPPGIDLDTIWHPWLVAWTHVHLTKGVTEHGAAFFGKREPQCKGK